jgi:xanthine dehydrogenase accessory factor
VSPDFYATAADFIAKGRAFAIATVVRVEGSSSAKRASRAIIDAEGKLVLGWIGGGCAESAVRSEALRCLEVGEPQIITIDMTDELLGVGMPCGGKMDVYIEPVLPSPELLIAGHGRIAEALAGFAHVLGFRVIVNDPGAERSAFPQAERVISEDFDLDQSPIGADTYVVIATQHKNDHIWLQKALQGEAAYTALVASQHRAKLVLEYLAAEGVAPEKIARISAPAGFNLGAATPEEIALSIISQIVAVRRGGTGEPLKNRAEAMERDTGHNAETIAHEAAVSDRVISHCDIPDRE